MDDEIEFLNDYKDCLNYIINFNDYDSKEISKWAEQTYIKWITKDDNYNLSITGRGNPPENDVIKASIEINNLKKTLEKIAIIKGINYNKNK